MLNETEAEVLAEGVRYLRVESAFYWGIGFLFLFYGLYRAVCRPGVSVVLTVRSGMERVLAQDVTASRADGDAQSTTKTVILSTGSGEETVLLSQNYPTFQGALVVCRGGDDPQVKLLLTQAVAALTGLGSDRITVCKGS